MGATDKAKHAADEAKGKVKEMAGRLTDDREIERKGRKDQAGAELKQAGEHVKDAFNK